jgi:hypothetical protein
MRHRRSKSLLDGLVIVLLSVGASAARGQDEIRYYDRTLKKDAAAIGAIQEETPAGIVYKPVAGASTKEIAAGDITDVIYEMPGALNLVYRRARADERKNPADALKGFQELLSGLSGEKYARAARHIQFKIAMMLARQAEEDPGQIDSATLGLEKFIKEQRGGWQLLQCARMLSHLQLLKDDSAGARKTFEELAAIPGIPAEIKQEAELLAIEALIPAKQFALAEKKLEELLASMPADSPQALRVRIELAHCQGASGKVAEAAKQLESLIAQTEDKGLKAHAYNALGDCYERGGRNKEALWAYLWVDVIYHQDRQEQAKAMEQLARIFDEQGNKERARIYRDKLKRPEK